MQLFEGKLWKCAKIAYLRLIKELSEDWTPYLNYRPLFSGCTDEELRDFIGKREEPCCGMCPSAVEHFTPHPYRTVDRCGSPATLDNRGEGARFPAE
jgi:hypothetical protein